MRFIFSNKRFLTNPVRRFSLLKINHYEKVSKNYLINYFDQYVLAYNKLSDKKRDSNYSIEVSTILEKFNNVHAYVGESSENKNELLAGTLLVEIKTDFELNLFNEVVGEKVNQLIKKEISDIDNWKENGMLFHKGSFKITNDLVSELYTTSFLVPGIHIYSTLPQTHDKIYKMFLTYDKKYHKVHKLIASDMIMDKQYNYYMFHIS